MFWETFVYLCSERGESPNAVAELCGVKSSGTVTGWKRGAIPRAAVLRRIADHFDVETSVFSLPTIYIPPRHANAEKEKTATPEGDGDRQEFIRAWDEASPEQRALALATLKLKVSPAGSQEKPKP